MQKFIKVLISLSLTATTLLFASCSDTSSDSDVHRHSVLPGSEYCDSCGEAIVICKECNMVSGATDEKCWFCKSSLS